MNVREPRRLLGHRSRHRLNAVADGHHRRAARRVENAPAVVGVEKTTLAARGARIFFQEIPWEYRFVRHGLPELAGAVLPLPFERRASSLMREPSPKAPRF
jgi:hypothetical protein